MKELINQENGGDLTISESAAMISMLERAALNPDVDIEKMERLWAMKERMDNKEAEKSFNTAMAKAQSEMGSVSADAANPQTKSRYASYAAIDSAVRPIYTQYGFSLSFDTGQVDGENVLIICHVGHSDGHSRDYKVIMPTDGKGAKGHAVMTKTHASGAAFSYGSRYLLKMIFNISIGDEDVDGNELKQIYADVITDEQVAALRSLISEKGKKETKLVAHLKRGLKIKINAIEQLPKTYYSKVVLLVEKSQ